MSGVNEKIVTVKKLLEGHYVFKLTVTDDKGLTGSDTVAVNVKKGEVQNKASVIFLLWYSTKGGQCELRLCDW